MVSVILDFLGNTLNLFKWITKIYGAYEIYNFFTALDFFLQLSQKYSSISSASENNAKQSYIFLVIF